MMLHTLAQDSPMAILVAFPPTCHACTACSKQAEPCQRGDRGPWGCKCRAPGSGRQPPSRRDKLGSRTRRARGSFGRGKLGAGGTRACARGCLCLTPGSPQHPTVTPPPLPHAMPSLLKASKEQSRANEGTQPLGAASAGLRETASSLPRAVTGSGAARAALAASLAAASA